jgi:hypothetical protein
MLSVLLGSRGVQYFTLLRAWTGLFQFVDMFCKTSHRLPSSRWFSHPILVPVAGLGSALRHHARAGVRLSLFFCVDVLDAGCLPCHAHSASRRFHYYTPTLPFCYKATVSLKPPSPSLPLLSPPLLFSLVTLRVTAYLFSVFKDA